MANSSGSSRKVAVVTGSRAEYGLLRPLLTELKAAPDLRLQLFVSAMHLSLQFGRTIDLIRADGFTVDAEVAMLEEGDSDVAVARSIGRGVIGFADAFEKLQPDILVLLGDRFETLAAASAAVTMRIPIAHIHGGEISEGAVDEYYRHAVSKMAALHFAAAPEFARRLIRMGEQPDRVFVVGAPGLDNLARLEPIARADLARSVGLDLSKRVFLVTYHPVTLGANGPIAPLEELLAALDRFPDAAVVITKSNADAGGRAINSRLEQFAGEHADRAVLVSSLGQKRYLNFLKIADVVIGNSSSGIIEAPAADTPTINIGDRQKGRPRAESIIDCEEDRDAIEKSIKRALTPEFRMKMDADPPFGRANNAARRMVDVLREIDPGALRRKSFYDGGSMVP